jgi:hypothetical protein
MDKKLYEAPRITKVRLDVRSAVLGTCRVTGDLTSRDDNDNCRQITGLGPCLE